MTQKHRIPIFLCLLAILLFVQLGESSAAREKKRILYLGDSMSMGAFGKTLDEEMRRAGFDVYTFVAGGATPYYWLSRYTTIKGSIGYWEKTPANERRQKVAKAVPKVETLLERYDPDVVIVQTGTNLYATLRSKRRSKANNVKEVEGLLNHMVEAATQGGRKCYWITPPEAHPGRYPRALQTELAELTKRVVSREAKVFDSRSVTKYTDPYPKNDGIHYGAREARQWASHVATDFRRFMTMESGTRRVANMPPEVSEVPRALPVVKSKPEPVQVNDKPPVKPAGSPAADPNPQPVVETPPVETPPEKLEDTPPEKLVEEARPPVQYVKRAIPAETTAVKWGKLDVEVKLLAKSKIESLKDIDYSYCFAMNEYEVLKVNSGYYPHDRIRIARVAMWSKRVMRNVIDEPVGNTPRGGWKLVPLANYPRFARMQTVDDLPVNLDLPVYIVAFE